ncbi:hypothetical protein FH972_025401 [Carpinus fangiana]|uniref:Morc S5 domain-containing protein n=1 Tax=Carpinus fangiana TaxID=176857 RepID=A0A5N6L3H8_9ROSI|nr:hypothetical protein FH972_025401 [Carpinus fangiana]
MHHASQRGAGENLGNTPKRNRVGDLNKTSPKLGPKREVERKGPRRFIPVRSQKSALDDKILNGHLHDVALKLLLDLCSFFAASVLALARFPVSDDKLLTDIVEKYILEQLNLTKDSILEVKHPMDWYCKKIVTVGFGLYFRLVAWEWFDKAKSYASILYLRLPLGFRIILRGIDVEHHNIVNDMMLSQEVTYLPNPGADGASKNFNMLAVVTIGFVKDAKHHIDVQVPRKADFSLNEALLKILELPILVVLDEAYIEFSKNKVQDKMGEEA